MNEIIITIAYAKSSEHQYLREVHVPAGSTILQVIEASKVCQEFPEIDLAVNKVGIFSEVKPLDTIVKAGDRVEIYRPLQYDPMIARRRRAKS